MEDTRRGFMQKLFASVLGSSVNGAIDPADLKTKNDRFEQVLLPHATKVEVPTKVARKEKEDNVADELVTLESHEEKVIDFLPLRYDNKNDTYQLWKDDEGWITEQGDRNQFLDHAGWHSSKIRAEKIEGGQRLWDICDQADIAGSGTVSEVLTQKMDDTMALNQELGSFFENDYNQSVEELLESSNNLEDIKRGTKKDVVNDSEEYIQFLDEEDLVIHTAQPRDYSKIEGQKVESFMDLTEEPTDYVWSSMKRQEDQKDKTNLGAGKTLSLNAEDFAEDYVIDFSELADEENYAEENIYHGDDIIINLGGSGKQVKASIQSDRYSEIELNYKLNRLSKGEVDPETKDEKALLKLAENY